MSALTFNWEMIVSSFSSISGFMLGLVFAMFSWFLSSNIYFSANDLERNIKKALEENEITSGTVLAHE
ncbi:hypothetical protein EIJ81_00900 (plasmid) [Aliivibrio salmonicida]|uniref:hypothetical protein n=1 Tax=Aliivibrio salmonicida TaxID=40269 RepID=UPI000F6E255C|nr:hypothetical protein [Aliivibrio salmonicida]AZL83458.1 hypothetical protein EIJ81_00900 [Aliivibrio salmonicida]